MLKTAIHSVLTSLLEQKINALEQRVAELEKRPQQPTDSSTKSWSQLFNSKSTELVKQRHQLINCVAQDNRERANRENNVIISGLSVDNNGQDDLTVTKKFLTSIGVNPAKVTKVRRFRPSPNSDSPGLILVPFENAADASEALRKGNRQNSSSFSGVFVREDRTPAQQTQFKELNEQKKMKNASLGDRLDLPFRYIIHRRSQTVRCIDVVKSAESKKCVFISPPRSS